MERGDRIGDAGERRHLGLHEGVAGRVFDIRKVGRDPGEPEGAGLAEARYERRNIALQDPLAMRAGLDFYVNAHGRPAGRRDRV